MQIIPESQGDVYRGRDFYNRRIAQSLNPATSTTLLYPSGEEGIRMGTFVVSGCILRFRHCRKRRLQRQERCALPNAYDTR